MGNPPQAGWDADTVGFRQALFALLAGHFFMWGLGPVIQGIHPGADSSPQPRAKRPAGTI